MDRELIKRSQPGDMNADDELFSKYENELYKFAFVYVKNEHDAIDLVQDVTYRSSKAIHTLKEPSYYKTWLIRILMNCAADLICTKNTYEQGVTSLIMKDTTLDIDVKVTLNNVMNFLMKVEKDVVLLKYYEDYTFKQIADCLEMMKIGSTKTILYQALKKLKVALEKEATTYEQFKR